MDYTTIAIVKSALRSKTAVTTDDTRLNRVITDASRAIDRELTGVPDADAINYLLLETKTNQVITGVMRNNGVILCYPRKPIVASISAFSYRLTPIDPWVDVEISRISIDGNRVEAYPNPMTHNLRNVGLMLTYSGGLAALVADLPADIVRAATILAIRYYREEETGLTDAIGVADVAPQGVVYTKEIPAQVLRMLQPYKRQVGWRYVA